jgi:hypothetical protein
LPLEAKALLPGATAELDAAAREAVAALGFHVQDRQVTLSTIQDAVDAGLDCSTLTDACVQRVGTAAEVDVVVTGAVEVVDGKMVLRVGVRPIGAGTTAARVRAGVVVLSNADGGASISQVVRRALTGSGAPTPLPAHVTVDPPSATLLVDGAPPPAGALWLTPGAHQVEAQAEGYLPASERLLVEESGAPATLAVRLSEEPSPVLLYTGLGLLATGGLLALGGGGYAGVVEARLALHQVRHDQRDGEQAGGIAALLVAGAGAAIAAIGVTTAVLGAP